MFFLDFSSQNLKMGDDNLESLVRNGFADMKTLFADVKADVGKAILLYSHTYYIL